MTPDWTTSFQALGGRVTASYETLLTRWQELLEKVSRGELAPASLRGRLPEFLQEEGAEFYRRLSALSFDLFHGLAEVQGNYTEDFMRGLVGDSAGARASRPAPPSPPGAGADAKEWTRWSHAVNAFITEQNESALTRYQVLLEKVAEGKLAPAAVQEFSRKFMNERALILSRDASEAQMRFFERLLGLNQEFVEKLFAVLVREGESGQAELEITPLDIIPKKARPASKKKPRKSKRR